MDIPEITYLIEIAFICLFVKESESETSVFLVHTESIWLQKWGMGGGCVCQTDAQLLDYSTVLICSL